MRDIRLLQLGHSNNTVLSNLALGLSRAQTAYDFIFEDDIVDVGTLPRLPNGEYQTRVIEQLTLRYMQERKYNEFPIAVTDLPLEDMLVFSADSTVGLLSTKDWSSFSKFPLIKGLEYLVAGVLLEMHEIGEIHNDTRACPNDYCEILSDIDRGIGASELCDRCHRDMLKALERGTIALQEAVAIYRILDHVADRRICFVLMPFHPKFASPYQAISQAIESAGFLVRRADQIFEPRSIIQIVYEQIGRAELIVADLTDRNPNVFYELGYAHALGKASILLAQNFDDIPFDLRHRQYLLYDPTDLGGSLGSKIKAYFF